jgi:hypothetical protein
MKNNESIQRAIEIQKKSEDIKVARLQAIDKRLVSPRDSSVEPLSKKKEPVLKQKHKPTKIEQGGESE